MANGEYNLKQGEKMTIQHMIEELKNIKEQALNSNNITKDDVVEAIEDLIHDASGDAGEWNFEDEDHYDSFNETDFTQLEVM